MPPDPYPASSSWDEWVWPASLDPMWRLLGLGPKCLEPKWRQIKFIASDVGLHPFTRYIVTELQQVLELVQVPAHMAAHLEDRGSASTVGCPVCLV